MVLDMHISLYKLEVFERVVDLGSVSRAAEALFVSQPVVSAHIRSLEERIGARLFYKEGRRLHLTEAGEAAHAWAGAVLMRTQDLARYLEGLSSGERGSAVLGASMSTGSYILPALLSRFRREWPHVEVKLHVAESEHVLEDTAAGDYDFALVILEARPNGPSLHVELLRHEELILVGAPESVPSEPIGIADLPTLPFLDSPENTTRRWVVNRELAHAGIDRELNVTLELGHPEAMKRVAQQGLGIAPLLRSSVEEEMGRGLLREVRIRDASFAVPLYLVHRAGRQFSPCQRRLMELIRSEVKAGASNPPAPFP